jgi:5'-3' exonuclease
MSIAWLTLVLCFLTTFTTTISAFLSPQVPRIPKRIRPSNDSPRHRPPLSPLYGIKGFQAWFNTQFPDATIEIDLSSHESFDHVLVDMNQVLHVILRRSRSREHAIRLLMSELDRMVQLTTPTQSLVLAVDGPPAAAKLATQRRRRYGTLVRTQWKLTHFDKLRISKRSRTKRLRGYQSDLKSLEITPATQFMKSMEASLIYWAWQRLQQRYSKLQNVKIYINPSAVPGEGEIKLLEWIFEHGPFYSSTNTTTTTNNNNKKQQRGQSICFFGGDSDLLLEGLVIPPSFAHNVFVVRQEQTKKYLCISLWETTRTLAKTLNTNNKQQILQVRTDLVLLMIMNGNDYLPKLRGSRGFSNIVSIYMKTLAKHNSGLVHPDTLDFHLDFCISFFKAVVQSSPPDLWSTTSSTNSSTSSTSTSNQPATQRSSKDNQEDDEPQPQSDRRTPLGELNNIIDGGFLPQRLRFRVIRDPTNINTNTNETEEEEDGVDDIDDDEEEEEEADIDDDDAQEEDNDDDDESSQVLVHMSLGNPGSDDFLLYEVWVDKDDPLKYAKQKLASMALDDFLGTDYAGGTDEFDFDAGITNRGYSWEISQAVEGKVDQYLGGLLWNLQTYQDGICADYGYNYGRRMSPTAIEIVDFLREAKAQSRRVGKQELLGDNDTSFRKPISAGLSCLAALPSEVKHLVPEPYQWLPNETVERLYEQCVDPIDNVFDLKTFEQLCEDEIAAVKLQRNETEEDVEHPHGRRIMTGDHYWTVLGKTNDPLKHPFDPPPPPSEEFSELFGEHLYYVDS